MSAVVFIVYLGDEMKLLSFSVSLNLYYKLVALCSVFVDCQLMQVPSLVIGTGLKVYFLLCLCYTSIIECSLGYTMLNFWFAFFLTHLSFMLCRLKYIFVFVWNLWHVFCSTCMIKVFLLTSFKAKTVWN